MNRVKIADLKNNLSRYVGYVRAGGEVVVLDRDTPVARLVPFAPADAKRGKAGDQLADERLGDLERQGLIKRGDAKAARDWLNQAEPIRLPKHRGSVVETLLQMRDEDAR